MIDSIYITIGASQIKEHGYKKYLKDFSKSNGEDMFWFYRMKNLPTRDFTHVYIVIGNQVRWKARLMAIEKDVCVHFSNGEVNEHFRGLVLIDFERMPKPCREKKGFQGFRYKYD